MRKMILDFIKNFQNEGTINTFTKGCCYWFALILAERFGGVIVYDAIENHFATLIHGCGIYDITGVVGCNHTWYNWEDYKKFDSMDAERVYHNCILKID